MIGIARLRLGLVLVVALLALVFGAAASASDGPGGQRPAPTSTEDNGAAGDDGTTDDTATDDTSTDDGAGDDTTAAATSCDEQDVVNPFERWRDDRDYVLGADFEDDLGDWTLEGGARAADGNERYDVGDESDSGSLLLPAGASATSPPLCVSDRGSVARFFTRAAKKGRLRIDVLAVDVDGSRRAAALRGGRGRGWRLTRRVPLKTGAAAQQVAVRFTAVKGTWRVDDLYVDVP
jgi:hypothetical protein